MAQLFQCQVGLSDHTIGIGAAVAAVALGATVIEKHFTLSRADGGVDSTFSMEPEELKSLVVESERAFHAMGSVIYGVQKAEQKSLLYKRSLYVVEDIKPGDLFTKENVRVIRPGYGLEPKYYDTVIGKTSKFPIKKGSPLSWDLV
jgi:sialic acid synthase SpsE